MPGTYSQLLLHVVFSTRSRTPWIATEVAERLYPYIGGIIRAEKGVLYDIGGVEDRRRVEIEPTAIRRHGASLAVVATTIEPVTGTAGEPVAMREPGIVEEAFAERDPGRVGSLSIRQRSDRLGRLGSRTADLDQCKRGSDRQAQRNKKPCPNLTSLLMRHRVSLWAGPSRSSALTNKSPKIDVK